MAAEYEKRFKNFSQEEMLACIRELEAHVTVKGVRLLSTVEIEELLTLVAADYFRTLFRMRIKETARGKTEFEEKLDDFEAAVERMAAHCLEVLESEDEDAAGECLFQLHQLRSLHPAVWFHLYRRLRKESLSVAVELEADDKNEPFKKP